MGFRILGLLGVCSVLMFRTIRIYESRGCHGVSVRYCHQGGWARDLGSLAKKVLGLRVVWPDGLASFR